MERILFAFVSLFLFSQPSLARDPLTPEEVAVIVQQFSYQGNYEETKSIKDGGFFDRCWIYTKEYTTEYPGMVEPLKVKMTMYIPNRDDLGEESVPAVIMVPPIGGVNLLDRKTASTLCSYDMAAMILSNDFANIERQASGKLLPAEDHHETYFRISAAVKGAMAMIRDDENLDDSRIGIFGVSLGGILSSFVMATQPEISAGYFLVAGGDVPQILATSEQEEVSKIRRKRMRAEGLETVEEYEAYLRQYITLDPIDLGTTMLPESLNMVISNQDSHVPSPNQKLLHEAFGTPEASYYEDGHVMTVLAFLFPSSGRNRIARFFQDRFAEPNPRPAIFSWLEQFLPVSIF